MTKVYQEEMKILNNRKSTETSTELPANFYTKLAGNKTKINMNIGNGKET